MPSAVFEAAIVIAALTALRAFAAFNVPLTADEAYYWTWSLHPAAGYNDHPPLVAWLIWLGTHFGSGPGFVRLPFVLCEAFAAVAAGRAAALLSRSRRAGALAAVLVALIPQTKLALGEALPDGPFLAAWAAALWAAAALARRPERASAAALGMALGAAVLARDFGWALAAGILAWLCEPRRRRSVGAANIALSVGITAACYVPFVLWNASHGWEHVAFAFHTREHFAAGAARFADVSTQRFLAYAAIVAAATWAVALRARPRVTLVAWTALPLPAILFVFSLWTTTESYWIAGPALSLAVGAGIALHRAAAGWRVAVVAACGAGALYATGAALFLALPEDAQARVFAASPALRGPLSSGVYVYAPLADVVRGLAAGDHGATVLTDRYETSAELLWFGIDSRIVVGLPQQRQWLRWHAGARVPEHALLVTFGGRPGPALMRAVSAAYERVGAPRELELSFAGAPLPEFDLVQLDGARPDARRQLPGL